MSCHDIGRGINTIVYALSNIYDKGEITQDAFKEMVSVCMYAVNWCDGNGYEAIQCIIGEHADFQDFIKPVVRCGACLRKLNNEVIAYNENVFRCEELKQNYTYDLISCMDCFNKYLKKYENKFKFVKLKDKCQP